MTVVINGTTGITNVNGSAAAPANTGTDTDTGIVYGTNTLSLATGGTTAVTVDSSQNVGIGTSSPTQKLDVNGNIRTAGEVALSGSDFVYSWAGGTTGQRRSGIYFDGASNVMRFYTSQAEAARIDSSGNLLVGATSQFNFGKQCIAFNGTNNYGLSLKDTADQSGARFVGFINGSGTVIGAIDRVLTTNAVQYLTSSDYRLKENVQPMTDALAKVAALKPVTYTWKDGGAQDEGFIAHELQEVVPACVSGEKDGVDAEGNPKYQGIDTSFLVATLTAAIQEQQAIIEQLRADIETLKGKA